MENVTHMAIVTIVRKLGMVVFAKQNVPKTVKTKTVKERMDIVMPALTAFMDTHVNVQVTVRLDVIIKENVSNVKTVGMETSVHKNVQPIVYQNVTGRVVIVCNANLVGMGKLVHVLETATLAAAAKVVFVIPVPVDGLEKIVCRHVRKTAMAATVFETEIVSVVNLTGMEINANVPGTVRQVDVM